LGQVLAKACNLQENPDLHDRALLYYRLLRTDVKEAAKIVQTPIFPITSFAEDESFQIMERVFQEFNTLSVVYGKPAETFIKEKSGQFERPAAQPKISHTNQDNVAPRVRIVPTPPLLDPASFQEMWGSLEPSAGFDMTTTQAPSDKAISDAFARHGVARLASGTVGDTIKVYLYGQEETTGELLLLEVLVNTTSSQLSTTIKSSAPEDIVVKFAESCQEWIQ